jgi:hypothetical protein
MSLPAVADEIKPFCTLDFDVDGRALADDVVRIDPAIWLPQATASVEQAIERRKDLDWAVVSLHSPNGDPSRTDPGLPGEDYAPTPVLEAMPSIQRLLASMPCEVMAARLLRLLPGASEAAHVDRWFGFDYGKVRLHVPIVTSAGALMWILDEPVHWTTNALWYADFAQTHAISNDGSITRVHLVVDCPLSDGLLSLFPPSHRPREVMISRRPISPAPVPALEAGRWHFTVDKAALDWSESRAPRRESINIELTVGANDEGPTLRLPSGVTARLRGIGDGLFRMGRMPEECLLALGHESVTIIRRQGSVSTEFPCTFLSRQSPPDGHRH